MYVVTFLHYTTVGIEKYGDCSKQFILSFQYGTALAELKKWFEKTSVSSPCLNHRMFFDQIHIKKFLGSTYGGKKWT